MAEKWTHTYVWGNLPWRRQRKGKKCRILVRAKRMNSILVEFENGEKTITSRWAVKEIKEVGLWDISQTGQKV